MADYSKSKVEAPGRENVLKYRIHVMRMYIVHASISMSYCLVRLSFTEHKQAKLATERASFTFCMHVHVRVNVCLSMCIFVCICVCVCGCVRSA